MPSTCYIKQCGLRKNKNQPTLTMRRYLQVSCKLKFAKKWKAIIGTENINPLTTIKDVCSIHFSEISLNKSLDVTRIRDGTVPYLLISENQAANLLSCEAGRGRWLCARGEPAASVVLQLARASTISSLTIGAHQAALVEVLVGRSEAPSEPYQVLVPSSVFLSPRESRGAEGARAERVRTFAHDALATGARDQRWDRVRIVATQPYNKQCKYGISFVHMFEPERPAPAPAAPLVLPLPEEEEEEETFRPGELFAQHRRAAITTTTDTGAQIRKATSQALRSDPDATAALKKAHVPRGRASKGPPSAGPEAKGPRDKDELLYSAEDRGPHRRIDRLLQQHDADKKENDTNTFRLKGNESGEVNRPSSRGEEPSAHSNTLQNDIERDKSDSDTSGKVTPRNNDARPRARRRTDEHRTHTHSNNKGAGEARSGSGARARPLEGVVFVLSGYENPRRARLRELAVSQGARPVRDWGPACTHLICAFPNTPKMRAVLAAGGASVPVVRGEWVEACARARRLLPWRAHATDPALRDRQPHTDPSTSECDTDDEIEEVLRQQKRRRTGGTPPARDESDSCDTEPPSPRCPSASEGELPALLEGLAFLVAERSAAPLDARLLARYARAYGGHLLTPDEAHTRAAPYYVLCGTREAGAEGEGGTRLRADWLWACHEARHLLPTDDYLLSHA